ncbi:MAG: nucleotidyl transferase AbiEii/AbiGii toxin family protein [Candidatus Thermoplasmatota archaeon]|nr:nucleotidyl transferase AbiEii/AbiGii toxin family protein [Candidatus Thermoplasmatota archaeon]
MNKQELKKYVGTTGYAMGQVEKDYLQHIVLGGLSRKIGGEITFKGGTALQKMGIVKRFSEDLDFTARKTQKLEKLERIMGGVLGAYNYPCETDKQIDDDRTIGFRMLIKGPLYRGKDSISSLRIEISKRETILLEPETREITPVYSDILPYAIEIMNLNEMASEKIRAILTRNKARDLYDLHILLSRDIKPSIALVNNKLQYYNMEFTDKMFKEKCHGLKDKWKTEIPMLVTDPPGFKETSENVLRRVLEILG